MWEDYLDGVRKAGSSCGAVIEVIARHVPVGLGAPIYGKLDAELANAMMSINAVKGVEIGEGFQPPHYLVNPMPMKWLLAMMPPPPISSPIMLGAFWAVFPPDKILSSALR